MTLTPDMVAQLRDHAERTACGPMRLLNGAKDKPAGLTSGMIVSWLRGLVESAAPEHFAYTLCLWEALPTQRRMSLTPLMVATLNAELSRTGMGPVTVLRHADDCPPDLTHQVINGWASQTVNSVGVAQWDYVLERLRGLPDGSTVSRSHSIRRQTHREIALADLAELRAHRERTGIGGAVLLKNARDIPPGLTPSMISSWLSGTAKVAQPDYVVYVLARYRARPSRTVDM